MTISQRMPVAFIGHGSPMNAIEENTFTQSLARLGKTWPKPKAIVSVSAHWVTEGTWVTAMPSPKTIHDFGGFPKALFDVQYPAPGSPEVAALVQKVVQSTPVNLDQEVWGLDHGTWSVLKHIYPHANIPVLQMSLDLSQPAEYHFKIGTELSVLRDQGVLILASGNVVHNLRQIKWGGDAHAYEWALEFDEWIRQKLVIRDFSKLMYEFHSSAAGKLSIPTLEHYVPVFYILGASTEQDKLRFVFEGIQNGSISMRSFVWSS